MADAKISALPSATTPVGTEVLPLVQSGVTTKISINDATGITRPFTANGVVYASSTTAQATGAALTFNGTNFATTGTATATKLIPTGSSVTGNGLYLPAANSVGLSTNGTNAVYIDSSQNVGIGTASPSTKLHVAGSSAIARIDRTADASANPELQLTAVARQFNVGVGGATFTTAAIQGAYYLYDATAAAYRFVIDSSGNVGIGTAAPNASAILDAQSTTKGVRMPNMTTTQKNAIASPAAGLMVFDTTLAKLCVYSGSAWQTITSV